MIITETTGAVDTGRAARRGLFRIMLRNPLNVASMIVLALFALLAIVGPWIVPFPPNLVRPDLVNAPPFTSEFVLGGDLAGRDILSRLIASAQGALRSAAILSVVSFALGVSAGLIAGYFGKLFESISNWLFSVILAVPGIIVLISLYTIVGTSTTLAMAVFGVLVAPSMYFMVRTLTRAVRKELYVDAARVSGLPNRRIIARHVLIAIRAPVILMTAGLAGVGIAVQAGLEFLGLGEPAVPSWGSMLTDAFFNIRLAPEQLVWPAIALGLVTGAFSLISIGLRDALEGTYVKPSRRERSRRIEAVRHGADARTEEARESPPVTHGPEPDGTLLLEIRDLEISYVQRKAITTVVAGVSLTVREGEVVGLVGESGSGKTQTVFAALGLLPDEAIVSSGSIRLGGVELLGMPETEFRALRGPGMAYVPQEPMSNLDPAFTIGSQLVYGLRAQNGCSRTEATEMALAMLERVGIHDPVRVFRSYPHQISGGMAQRVLIAGAAASRPRLLIADEPTTALDVTIQAEVLDLLRDLQQETNMGVLLVTHSFGVVADLCDRVVVMRDGRVVESGPVRDVFDAPKAEYTRSLLDAVLDHAPARGELNTKEVTRA